MTMKVLSLFSGIGGFDLGFQRAGMEVIGMCEIDKHAQEILKRQFPDATLHTDVREVSYAPGTVDLICGGFPCQDLSVAGKRRGLAGNRSGLWFEFARIIDEAEPAWVVIENVPGLFSSAGGEDLAIIIQWLAERGYGVGWRVLDAQGFGLAQRRKRVFIVGSFGTPSGCTLLLESESLQRHPTSSGKEGKDYSRTAQAGIDVSFTVRGPAGSTNGDGRVNNTLVPDVAKTLLGHHPRSDGDTETLVPDRASTLLAHGQRLDHESETLIPAATTVYSLQNTMVGSKGDTGGPHGSGISENISYTLTTQDPHVIAYNVSDDSGIQNTEVARTLDTTCARPSSGQGGNMVLTPYSIQGSMVDRDGYSNGAGISQENISYTLTATDRHAVAFPMTPDQAQTTFLAVQQVAPTLRAEAKQSLMTGDGNINAALAIGFSGQKSSISIGMESVPTMDSSTVSNVLWEASHANDPAKLCTDQDVSPTLLARMGTGGNQTPMIGVRRLTPTECERLQGFPVNWTAGQSDTQRYKQLGNAVAAPVAEWIGRRILKTVTK